MIDYISIKNTLELLEQEYNSALNNDKSDQQMPILFSKLAILELCGWIEVSIDNVLYEYVNNNVSKEENKKIIKERINVNYGFKFKSNLQPLFCSVFGIKNYETIIGTLSEQELANMQTTLGNLAKTRDFAAHNNTETGMTPRYNAPSQIISDYKNLKPAFEKIEKAVHELYHTSTNPV